MVHGPESTTAESAEQLNLVLVQLCLKCSLHLLYRCGYFLVYRLHHPKIRIHIFRQAARLFVADQAQYFYCAKFLYLLQIIAQYHVINLLVFRTAHSKSLSPDALHSVSRRTCALPLEASENSERLPDASDSLKLPQPAFVSVFLELEPRAKWPFCPGLICGLAPLFRPPVL
jgi:hypothetical protein